MKNYSTYFYILCALFFSFSSFGNSIDIFSSCDDFADNCGDAIDALTPVTDTSEFVLDYICVAGCLENANPSADAFGGCIESENLPTVWYKINADEYAILLTSTVVAMGDWSPVWAVYGGSCGNLAVIDTDSSLPCSNLDNTPDLHQSIITGPAEYWIAISVDPNSLPPDGSIDDGNFELCVSSTIEPGFCLGDAFTCTDPSFSMEVIAREFNSDDLDGPFLPGEEITVQVSYFYDASATGADWLIGIVPNYSENFDMVNYDYDANAPTGNGNTGEWHDEDGPCAPIIQEPVPNLCYYTDEDGKLKLCNTICENCTDCEGFLQEGDPLPGGYFWVSNGGNEGCANDCSPGEGWGIGSSTALIEWTFTLKVEEDIDCSDPLQVSFQPFSDGTAGCFEDPVEECAVNGGLYGPLWEVCCDPSSYVSGDDVSICSGDQVNVDLTLENGITLDIVVDAVDNPFVDGEMNATFMGGIGTITDGLINLTTDIQVVEYKVYVIDPEAECSVPVNTVRVTVLPSIQISIDPVFLCAGDCALLAPDIQGAGDESTYLWSTGETSYSVFVCPVDFGFNPYSVTVTSGEGCSQSYTTEVELLTEEECDIRFNTKLTTDFFIDFNFNGIRDAEDYSIADGSFYLGTDSLLQYNVDVPADTVIILADTYTLFYNYNDLIGWSVSTEDQFTVTVEEGACPFVEFGVLPTGFERDFTTSQYFLARCNSIETIDVCAISESTQLETGILWIEIDPLLIVPESELATVDTFIEPNLYGWFFEDLIPGQQFCASIEVEVPGPPAVPLGTAVVNNSWVEIPGENGAESMIFGESQDENVISCSYDPNDKAVNPLPKNGYTDIGVDELVYKIRFQNTGNAPAEIVTIIDTLSEFIDPASVQFLGSSHTEHLTFSRISGNILSFDFQGIDLPDSTANFEESQGYVLYSVQLKDSLEEGTNVKNAANIYFDNNPPIRTNTTESVLYEDKDMDGFFSIEDCDDLNASINPGAVEILNNDIDEDCDGIANMGTATSEINQLAVDVFPNPTRDIINLVISDLGYFEYSIHSMSGEKIETGKVYQGKSTISLMSYSQGVYFVKIKSIQSGYVNTFKIIKM